ncbi:MAG: glycoside hydrolase family 36 protein [Chitinophagales bacterium]
MMLNPTISLRSVLICLLLLRLTGPLSAQAGDRMEGPVDVESWITGSFARGNIPPFSFTYDGKPSDGFIKRWNYRAEKLVTGDSMEVKYRYTYTDRKTRLEASCEVTGYKGFQAVEWMLTFKNASEQRSGVLENVNAMDYSLTQTRDGISILHYALGSDARRSDFQPVTANLEHGADIYMTPAGGRSSNTTAFPFFNLEMPGKRGIVVGIGWTGTWYARIRQMANQSVALHSGMKNIKLFLYPQESIRTPRICMLFWQAEDWITGNNHFRRFILAHHSRMIKGKFAEYPLSAGFQAAGPSPCNENSCLTEDFALAIVNRYKQFNILPELFWLDAGWYTGSGGPNYEGRSWGNQVGNWTVDSSRFPRGLKPLSDAAHGVGAKFMLWFEPERVRKGTLFDRLHPEWMMKLPDNDNYLFNLGNPAARQWLTDYISRMIVDQGLDYYRQDFNMNPAAYWAAADEPGRQGISEIRHIEGLYAFWDSLLVRFPNLLIDNCASGGRRLDLETTSRSAPLWRTDYAYGEPNGYQNHTYGLSFWLPLSGTGAFAADTFTFRSSLSSAMVMNWPIGASDVSIPEMQELIRKYKELRPYYYEDYYPLTGTGDLTGDSIWLAYQLNRPSDGSGIVLAFRRTDSKTGSIVVKLSGLDKNRNYEIRNENDGKTDTKSGAQLEAGLTLELIHAPSSLLLQYKIK